MEKFCHNTIYNILPFQKEHFIKNQFFMELLLFYKNRSIRNDLELFIFSLICRLSIIYVNHFRSCWKQRFFHSMPIVFKRENTQNMEALFLPKNHRAGNVSFQILPITGTTLCLYRIPQKRHEKTRNKLVFPVRRTKIKRIYQGKKRNITVPDGAREHLFHPN